VKSNSEKPLPESSQCRQTASLHGLPCPASGKNLVMCPDCLKNTEACAGYCSDDKPQLRVDISIITPSPYNHGYHFSTLLHQATEQYLGYPRQQYPAKENFLAPETPQHLPDQSLERNLNKSHCSQGKKGTNHENCPEPVPLEQRWSVRDQPDDAKE